MIETDPPRHQLQRRVLSPEFTPRRISRLSERVREVTVGCIERARELGTFDFVAEVAHVIPATVTLELLGVPEADRARLAELEHAFLNPPDTEGETATSDPMMELGMYFYELLNAKEGAVTVDLLDRLLAVPVEGQRRSVIELIGEAVLLLNGGLDTTRAAASAGGLLPRPLLKVKAGDPLVLQFFFTNTYPHGEIKGATVSYFVVREEKPRQKNVPDLTQGVITQGRFTLNFKPKGRAGARVHFTITTPGFYLVRVQSGNTQSDHEHFSALDLQVE